MLSLGAFAFASPLMLLGLLSLPAIWWLLRISPPLPKRVRFPAIRLLVGLDREEETPANTPLWLLILRLTLAALIVFALANPDPEVFAYAAATVKSCMDATHKLGGQNYVLQVAPKAGKSAKP